VSPPKLNGAGVLHVTVGEHILEYIVCALLTEYQFAVSVGVKPPEICRVLFGGVMLVVFFVSDSGDFEKTPGTETAPVDAVKAPRIWFSPRYFLEYGKVEGVLVSQVT